MKSAVKVPEVGIHVLHIGRSDTVVPLSDFLIEGGAQVKKDAFIDQGHDGFVCSVERKLALFAGGKLPEDFLLVITERLENAFLAFSGGAVTRALDEVLADCSEATYDETGCGYKKDNANYVPVLVCVLGESDSFKSFMWGQKDCPAGYTKNPVEVLNRKQTEKLFEDIKRTHASSVAESEAANKVFPTPGGVG